MKFEVHGLHFLRGKQGKDFLNGSLHLLLEVHDKILSCTTLVNRGNKRTKNKHPVPGYIEDRVEFCVLESLCNFFRCNL